MRNELLIILDSDKYRAGEPRIREAIQDVCKPVFFYTDYENKLIKFLHGVRGIGNPLSHIAYWTVSLWDAGRIYAFKKQPRKLFVNPIVGFFYCLLSSAFRCHDTIAVAGFLFEDKSNPFYLKLRKRFVDFAYKGVDQLIVYSSIEEKKYSSMFPGLSGKIEFIKYGRDFEVFRENEFLNDTHYVASGGGSNRDFKTLVAAMALLEYEGWDIKVKIATRPSCLAGETTPANVELLYNIRMDMFGSFLDKSRFVVLPLKDNNISAGHMSLMESMHLGKAIIITDIPSVRDYVDESQVFFYPPGDSRALAQIIKYVDENLHSEEVLAKAAAARHLYETEYNFSNFLKRLAQTTL